MSISVNGESQVPPGFRFHPTEEELLHYYLKKKVAYEKIDLDVIRDVDLNKLEPWDIQEKCKIGSTPQNDWYFFSHKDKKYPTGTRTNRATAAGFWKATGRDKVIYSSFKRIGMRKTLVFYKGRAPHGQKSDWIMHEYRLDDTTTTTTIDTNAANSMGEMGQEDGWVVCRVFKKKNHHKSFDSPNNSSVTSNSKTHFLSSSNDGALDQILNYMGRSCKKEEHNNIFATTNTTSNNGNMRYFKPFDMVIGEGVHHDRFMQLPPLESPTLPTSSSQTCYHQVDNHVLTDSETSITNQGQGCTNLDHVYHTESGLSDWVALDRFVASHLNGQAETSKQLACFNEPNLAFSDQDLQLQQIRPMQSNRIYENSQEYNTEIQNSQEYNSEIDLWNFTRSSSSSSDQLCNLSNSSA